MNCFVFSCCFFLQKETTFLAGSAEIPGTSWHNWILWHANTSTKPVFQWGLMGTTVFFNKECIGWTKTVCHAGQHNTFQYLWKQTISTTCGGWRNKKCHSCDVKAIGHALRRKETSVRSNDTLIKPINWFFWRMNPIIQKHVHYLVHIQGDVLSWRSAMKLFPTNSSSRRTKKGV